MGTRVFVWFEETTEATRVLYSYLEIVSNYRSPQNASRPLHTKCWSHPEGQILVQLCICLERISRFTCTWPNNLPNHSPKHCWDVAWHLPRIETWVFQAWVTDVRQTQKTRSNTLDPCSSWCPWPYFLPWIHLQPSSYRNLRNLQSTSSKRSIVRTRLPRRTWRYKTLCS